MGIPLKRRDGILVSLANKTYQRDFVADNKEKLPAGWEQRLSSLGDSQLKAK